MRYIEASRKYPEQSRLIGALMVAARDISELVAAGKIPAAGRVRRPPTDRVTPHSEPNEAVVFGAFFAAGLGLPVTPLIAGVLEYYGLELPQLRANAVARCWYFLMTLPEI